MDLQRLPADADDAVVWQRFVNAALTLGVKRLVGRSSLYNVGTYVNLGGANWLLVECGRMNATLVKPTVAAELCVYRPH